MQAHPLPFTFSNHVFRETAVFSVLLDPEQDPHELAYKDVDETCQSEDNGQHGTPADIFPEFPAKGIGLEFRNAFCCIPGLDCRDNDHGNQDKQNSKEPQDIEGNFNAGSQKPSFVTADF